jgi:hypothetical protein
VKKCFRTLRARGVKSVSCAIASGHGPLCILAGRLYSDAVQILADPRIKFERYGAYQRVR